jgi:hypothetical protein
MGSVECVTFHEPASQESFGGGMVGEGSVVGSVEGARRATIFGGVVVFGACGVTVGEDAVALGLFGSDARLRRAMSVSKLGS